MPLHRAGGKLTKNHTTLIDAAAELIDHLQECDEVTKISLGLIKNIGKGRPGLKFHPLVGGWRVVVRGSLSLQEIVIYTAEPEKVKRSLLRLEAGRKG